MSKSNPKLTNPATKFIEFKGDTGQWFYYDKETEEKKELKTPFYFVVLDELSSIKGFSKRAKSGVYSNEVRFIKDEPMTVKSFTGGISIIGKYSEIKDAALREGGKYCKSVYAMLIKDKGVYELVNFQLHGASFTGADEKGRSGWINKKVNTETHGIVVKDCENGTVGNVEFLAPIFDKVNLNPEVDAAAVEMDKKLQIYLASYFNKQVEEKVTESEAIQDKETPWYPDDIDQKFEEMREKAKEDNTNPEDSSDLPF